MAQLFARVELRGTPGEDVYQRLHAYMESLFWYRSITGTTTVSLPHAVYQATINTESPDLAAVAAKLKSGIQTSVWSIALVLIVQSSNWAQCG
jgi:hypothetical protein